MVSEESNESPELGISQSHPILPSYKKQGGASLEFYNHRANSGWRGFLSTFVTSGTSWYPLGYPHPLPTLFIASLNSLRNPWSFGSPFSLGHCQVSSRRDFHCSALTLLLMGDKSWLDLPGEIIFPVHHFVNPNCWEKPGRSLQNPSECELPSPLLISEKLMEFSQIFPLNPFF